MKLLSVFGTRPEAIKMAPLLAALNAEPSVRSLLCVTGQHRELLEQALAPFGIVADHDLRLMRPGQSLAGLIGRAVARLGSIYERIKPDRVLVHGDTASALAGAIAAYHLGIPVGHVEAGLRTYRLDRPFPEEMSRRTIDMCSDLLFAPGAEAQANLEAEGVEGRIFVTGNTAVDALEAALRRLETDPELRRCADAALPPLRPGRKILLVTAYRRESMGLGLSNICTALTQLAQRSDLEIVFPVHPNPAIDEPVREALGDSGNIHLPQPLDHGCFVRLMQRADLILTDSGGIQEEAPTLGKPVLVMREASERTACAGSGLRLTGTKAAFIVRDVAAMLDDPAALLPAMSPNPHGDGRASARIVDALLGRPFVPFASTAPQAEQMFG
jgi:UDP-N-acetylglucosamine 2-epimerase (non-hydrolysing)